MLPFGTPPSKSWPRRPAVWAGEPCWRNSMSNRLTACMVPVALSVHRTDPPPPPPPPLSRVHRGATVRRALAHPPPPPPLGIPGVCATLRRALATPPPPNLSHKADVLQWVMVDRGVSAVDRYLYAFITMQGLAGSSSPECEGNLARIPAVCDDLGVQLAADKLEGPSECLTFLGIDKKAGLVPFPSDKLAGLKALLAR